MREDSLRKSSYNIVIPLSTRILQTEEPAYLLCNPVQGNVSLITEKEYKTLREFPESTDEQIISELTTGGYITHLTEEEEKKLMEKKYEAQKKPKDPRASFVLTYNCNLRCEYCWSDYLFKEENTAVIDEETVDAAFDAISHIPALESVSLMSLYGGEPFLPSTRSVVQYILEKGSERGYHFHTNTNGYYLKTFVPLLAQYNMAGVSVTLDGCADIHNARRKKSDGSGTFDQIVEGVDAALDAGISMGVRINVDAENIDHLPAFGDWIKEHGWAHQNVSFTVSPVRPGIDNEWRSHLTYSEMGKRIIDLMKDVLSFFQIVGYSWEYTDEGYLPHTLLYSTELKPRPFYCHAHYQGYIFDPFGDIYSCPRAVGDKLFSIGRFIPELQFNETYEKWFNRDVLSIPTCRDCTLALLCGGGCAYEAYLTYNTLHEGYCRRYRAFINYGLPLFVKTRMKMEE